MLISVATANTLLTHALILYLLQFYYLYVMLNHSFLQYMVLQTRIFNHESISIRIVIFLHFLRTPLQHGLAFYNLNHPLCSFPSYLNHAFVYFNQVRVTIYLMYPLQVKELISKNYYISLLQNTLYTAE